jgi:hypothetical protein
LQFSAFIMCEAEDDNDPVYGHVNAEFKEKEKLMM